MRDDILMGGDTNAGFMYLGDFLHYDRVIHLYMCGASFSDVLGVYDISYRRIPHEKVGCEGISSDV